MNHKTRASSSIPVWSTFLVFAWNN